MKLVQEFKAFALKGNVIDLAVAVVIGTAFTKVVTALVDTILMPLVGALLPAGEWRNWEVTPLDLKVGQLLGAVVDFILVALVLFLVIKKLGARLLRENPPAPAAPTTRACPDCLEQVPLKARRCRACTSPLPT
jgi:large conductance mechanosensitive channel